MMVMSHPTGVLLCRPDYFQLVDVKNPFMAGQSPVDTEKARRQWESVRDAFIAGGLAVHEVEPVAGAEDMVFTANPAFTGLDRDGRRVAVASRMKHPSRRAEVDRTMSRLAELGYRTDDSIPESVAFEGGGDAVWHPGKHVIYGGYGARTSAGAYTFLERAFGAEIVPLRLADERFYHLDTALCALDEETAIVVPGAFDAEGLSTLETRFSRVLKLDSNEALTMAANAAAARDRTVVIEQAAAQTIPQLRDLGYHVLPVDTSEFRKSGGSVYCMKQYLF